MARRALHGRKALLAVVVTAETTYFAGTWFGLSAVIIADAAADLSNTGHRFRAVVVTADFLYAIGPTFPQAKE